MPSAIVDMSAQCTGACRSRRVFVSSASMILAIDLGSTSFKAGLFDSRLRLIRSNSAPLKYRYAAGGHVELEVATVNAALKRIMAGMNGYKVIAITSQAQTFTVLDRRGKPTRPFISWQDGRVKRPGRLPDC